MSARPLSPTVPHLYQVLRAHYYRETAESLRERAPNLKWAEARSELRALAREYERLADFVGSKPAKPHGPPQ
jgi:hypothetical protein